MLKVLFALFLNISL